VAVVPLPVRLGRYVCRPDGSLVEVERTAEVVPVPLAHTEGGLSLSLLRGARAAEAAGGVATYVLADRITRDSCFVFDRTEEALALAALVEREWPELARWLHEKAPTEHPGTVSRHARLVGADTYVVGGHCHILWRFQTGEATGPNMMTRNAFLLNARLAEVYLPGLGMAPRAIVLEANMGGDKKPSYQFFHEGHGKTVLASVEIPRRTVQRRLGVSPEQLRRLEHVGLHGAHASGMQSFAFTPASVVAAVFAATGQDLGMVGTSSMAHGQIQVTERGVLFSLRLSGLEVGTVGGGTELPHARRHLALMGCEGEGSALRLAQVIAAAALCLEISASAAMATERSENFFQAHRQRGGRR